MLAREEKKTAMNSPSEPVTGIVEVAAQPDPSGDLLTFLQWKARGRHVRRGEHGTRVPAWQTVDGSAVNVESEGSGLRTMATLFRFDQTRGLSVLE